MNRKEISSEYYVSPRRKSRKLIPIHLDTRAWQEHALVLSSDDEHDGDHDHDHNNDHKNDDHNGKIHHTKKEPLRMQERRRKRLRLVQQEMVHQHVKYWQQRQEQRQLANAHNEKIQQQLLQQQAAADNHKHNNIIPPSTQIQPRRKFKKIIRRKIIKTVVRKNTPSPLPPTPTPEQGIEDDIFSAGSRNTDDEGTIEEEDDDEDEYFEEFTEHDADTDTDADETEVELIEDSQGNFYEEVVEDDVEAFFVSLRENQDQEDSFTDSERLRLEQEELDREREELFRLAAQKQAEEEEDLKWEEEQLAAEEEARRIAAEEQLARMEASILIDEETEEAQRMQDEERQALEEELEYLLEKQMEDELTPEEQDELERTQVLLDMLKKRPASKPSESWTKAPDTKQESIIDHEVGYRSPSLLAMVNQARMELRKPPPEGHKKSYVPIVQDAASIGRLVRLNEYIVEAQGQMDTQTFNQTSTDRSFDDWITNHSQRGQMRMPVARKHRSKAQIMVNEAAALGKLRTRQKVRDPLAKSSHHDEIDIDDMGDDKHDGAKVFRTEHLIDRHVGTDRRKKSEDWTPEYGDQEYDNLDEVVLPTDAQPEFKPKPTKKTTQELHEELARGVAEGYWSRYYRLERPGAPLKVTEGCPCKFCKHPNAWQTFAYQKKWAQNRLPPAVSTAEDPEQFGHLSRLYLPQEQPEDVEFIDLKEEGRSSIRDVMMPISADSTCSVDFSLSSGSLSIIGETSDEASFCSFGEEDEFSSSSFRVEERAEDDGVDSDDGHDNEGDVDVDDDGKIPECLEDSVPLISDIETTLGALEDLAQTDDAKQPPEPVVVDRQQPERTQLMKGSKDGMKKPGRFNLFKWMKMDRLLDQNPNLRKSKRQQEKSEGQVNKKYDARKSTYKASPRDSSEDIINSHPRQAASSHVESDSIETPHSTPLQDQLKDPEATTALPNDESNAHDTQDTTKVIEEVPRESIRDRLSRLKELQALKRASEHGGKGLSSMTISSEHEKGEDAIEKGTRALRVNGPLPRETLKERANNHSNLEAMTKGSGHSAATAPTKNSSVSVNTRLAEQRQDGELQQTTEDFASKAQDSRIAIEQNIENSSQEDKNAVQSETPPSSVLEHALVVEDHDFSRGHSYQDRTTNEDKSIPRANMRAQLLELKELQEPNVASEHVEKDASRPAGAVTTETCHQTPTNEADGEEKPSNTGCEVVRKSNIVVDPEGSRNRNEETPRHAVENDETVATDAPAAEDNFLTSVGTAPSPPTTSVVPFSAKGRDDRSENKVKNVEGTTVSSDIATTDAPLQEQEHGSNLHIAPASGASDGTGIHKHMPNRTMKLVPKKRKSNGILARLSGKFNHPLDPVGEAESLPLDAKSNHSEPLKARLPSDDAHATKEETANESEASKSVASMEEAHSSSSRLMHKMLPTDEGQHSTNINDAHISVLVAQSKPATEVLKDELPVSVAAAQSKAGAEAGAQRYERSGAAQPEAGTVAQEDETPIPLVAAQSEAKTVAREDETPVSLITSQSEARTEAQIDKMPVHPVAAQSEAGAEAPIAETPVSVVAAQSEARKRSQKDETSVSLTFLDVKGSATLPPNSVVQENHVHSGVKHPSQVLDRAQLDKAESFSKRWIPKKRKSNGILARLSSTSKPISTIVPAVNDASSVSSDEEENVTTCNSQNLQDDVLLAHVQDEAAHHPTDSKESDSQAERNAVPLTRPSSDDNSGAIVSLSEAAVLSKPAILQSNVKVSQQFQASSESDEQAPAPRSSVKSRFNELRSLKLQKEALEGQSGENKMATAPRVTMPDSTAQLKSIATPRPMVNDEVDSKKTAFEKKATSNGPAVAPKPTKLISSPSWSSLHTSDESKITTSATAAMKTSPLSSMPSTKKEIVAPEQTLSNGSTGQETSPDQRSTNSNPIPNFIKSVASRDKVTLRQQGTEELDRKGKVAPFVPTPGPLVNSDMASKKAADEKSATSSVNSNSKPTKSPSSPLCNTPQISDETTTAAAAAAAMKKSPSPTVSTKKKETAAPELATSIDETSQETIVSLEKKSTYPIDPSPNYVKSLASWDTATRRKQETEELERTGKVASYFMQGNFIPKS